MKVERFALSWEHQYGYLRISARPRVERSLFLPLLWQAMASCATGSFAEQPALPVRQGPCLFWADAESDAKQSGDGDAIHQAAVSNKPSSSRDQRDKKKRHAQYPGWNSIAPSSPTIIQSHMSLHAQPVIFHRNYQAPNRYDAGTGPMPDFPVRIIPSYQGGVSKK